MNQDDIERLQKSYCAELNIACVPTPGDTKSGFATETNGAKPINGLRHPTTEQTSGWYIWCGEHFSTASNFFAPIHTEHIYEEFPKLIKLLGLPPGYRFLLADENLDVWYDDLLLTV